MQSGDIQKNHNNTESADPQKIHQQLQLSQLQNTRVVGGPIIGGHPNCNFCEEPYFDNDQLYFHLERVRMDRAI